ncbi:uncharacterized protein NESG_00573 [Nematocida ausubeli]|uniref:Uncharacterized protein n=1 Tax=Nematocida ausubeli (strain ATCC PRA-371 / ERTm2) TaxID=1913371 RepID=A0A086J5S5_NEMA1|nr:uncharacterized protein NESG_00573 [Nematocida ausubeli]KFG27493.1 hypothetical protein NESG_00573 [Nematocida ausubeli]
MNMKIKRKTHEHLYKRNNRQISIKLLAKVLLMGALLFVQNVFGLLSEEDMKAVIKAILSKTKGDTMLKLDGPFSPIMLYLYEWSSTLQNKRFDSSYISNCFLIIKEEDTSHKTYQTNHIAREEDSEGKKIPKRIVDHYNALINMFPSPKRKIGIYPKKLRKESFTSFLKSEHVKEYAHRILAVLLLQAEGMPVSLRIEDEESACPKLTWMNEYKPKDSFSIPIYTTSTEGQESNSSNEEANIKKSSIKIVQTIKYFLNAESSQELEESIALKESTEKEIYWKNEFTETPAWLIQSYIYYYLETKEDAINFYDEMSDKLRLCFTKLKEKNNAVISTRLFQKWLTKTSNRSVTLEWWGNVKELKDLVEAEKEIKPLPFKNNSLYLPTKKNYWPKYEYYKTCTSSPNIESTLFTLFCCFVYDPETNTYNVDQIPCAQEEVKNLFGMPSKNTSTSSDSPEKCENPAINNPLSNDMPVIRMGQGITKEAWDKWREIIKSLVRDDEDISYIKLTNGRHVIEQDILNILIIMLKLTGMYYDINKKEIQSYKKLFESERSGYEKPLTVKDLNSIIRYVESIFSMVLSRKFDNRMPEDFRNRFSTSFKDKKPRILYMNFVDYQIKSTYTKKYLTKRIETKYLAGSLQIYYKTENRKQPIIISFISPEIVELGIGMCFLLSEIPKIDILAEKISKMPKDSYSMHVLSEYAETINLSNPTNMKVDQPEYNPNETLDIA